MNYEEKYKKLVAYINSRYEEFKKLETKEPHWPYKIQDFKLVVQFRNDILNMHAKLVLVQVLATYADSLKNRIRSPEQGLLIFPQCKQ